MRTRLLALVFALFLCRAATAGDRPLRVAVDPQSPPMNFIDDSGRLSGFTIDFFNAVAKEADFDIRFVTVPWEGIFQGLAEKKFDVVASSVTITPEREAIVDFTIPYFEVFQAVVMPLSIEMTGVGDLEGRRLGAQAGTTGVATAESVRDAKVAIYPGIDAAFGALEEGEVDGIICDEPLATSYVLENYDKDPPMRVAVTFTGGDPDLYGFAVKKGEFDLLNRLNNAIERALAKGVDGELRRKWIGD